MVQDLLLYENFQKFSILHESFKINIWRYYFIHVCADHCNPGLYESYLYLQLGKTQRSLWLWWKLKNFLRWFQSLLERIWRKLQWFRLTRISRHMECDLLFLQVQLRWLWYWFLPRRIWRSSMDPLYCWNIRTIDHISQHAHCDHGRYFWQSYGEAARIFNERKNFHTCWF